VDASQVKVQDDPVVEGSAAALARPRIGGDGNPPPGPVAVCMRPLSHPLATFRMEPLDAGR